MSVAPRQQSTINCVRKTSGSNSSVFFICFYSNTTKILFEKKKKKKFRKYSWGRPPLYWLFIEIHRRSVKWENGFFFFCPLGTDRPSATVASIKEHKWRAHNGHNLVPSALWSLSSRFFSLFSLWGPEKRCPLLSVRPRKGAKLYLTALLWLTYS